LQSEDVISGKATFELERNGMPWATETPGKSHDAAKYSCRMRLATDILENASQGSDCDPREK
jgi:hypothetical protein